MVFNEDDVAVKAVTYIKTRQEEETKTVAGIYCSYQTGMKDWELE